MKRTNISRRALLQATGLSAGLLPLLNAGSARAAGPKRLVVLTWPNGIHPPEFWPTGTETDFKFGQIMASMEPFKNKMLILGGLDQNAFIGQLRPSDNRRTDAGWGHDAYLSLLTGERYLDYREGAAKVLGDSIDMRIADEIAKTTKLPFHSLQIGARTASGFQSCISARARTEGTTPENDPVRLWTKLFEGRSLPAGKLDTTRVERRSILDYVGKELESFSQSVSPEDRDKVKAHMTSVRELEQQFSGDGISAGCTSPDKPATFDLRSNDNYPKLVKLQMDLMVAALKCDLTRVISYNMTNTGGSGVIFSWLGSEFTGPGDEYPNRDHHDIAHQQGRSAAHLQRYVGLNKWYYQQFAYFIDQLNKIPEGTGTMLDNTVVLITNVMGVNHMAVGLPFVLVGSCGGYFKTGRLLKYGDWAGKADRYWQNKGIPHNQLLVSLANAMDVPITQFGSSEFPTGPLPGLKA